MKLIDIAFDLDGTLVDLLPVFRKIIWNKYKAIVPDYRGFKIYTEPNLEYEKILECFDETFKYINEIYIFPEAQEFLTKLYNLSNKDPIRIVTARPIKSAHQTYEICKRICKGIDFEVIIVGHGENKIKYLNRYNYYVDDRRKTSLQLSSYGKKVFMLKRKYNQPLPEGNIINEIETLNELIPIADRFIKEI